MSRALPIVLAWFASACAPVKEKAPPPETTEQPVEHRKADAQCISDFEGCYKRCETAPHNLNYSSSGLGVPSVLRIQECQLNCEKKNACLPWQIGVLTGKPCRVTFERYECNFFLCSAAATACLDDCFNVYKLTNPQAPAVTQADCIEQCYGHYGCRPHPTPADDPCRPLPEGHVYCACPEAHGVNCHLPGQSCP